MSRRLTPWLWGLAIAVIAYSPTLYLWDRSGWGDWQYFHHAWEVGRIAILRFGEWPLWEPHHCGGVPMWGQPQSQFLSPLWWLTAIPFGTVHGHKLFILAHHAIGFVGMFVVARRLYGLGVPAAALAALAWAFSGYFGWRASGGHSPFLAFHYVPWVLYCWRRTHEDLRYAGGVAALLTLQLAEGGTYPFPFTFLLLTFDALAQLAGGEWRVFRTGLITGILTLLVGAIRLWPVYVLMGRFPRGTTLDDAQTFEDVLESLTAREPHPWVWGHRWVWAEYSSYVGWGVVVLAGFGALVALRRARTWHVPLGVALFAALAMGNRGEHWPWPLLHQAPVFENFHVEARFHVLLTFYLALLAAFALDTALARLAAVTTDPATLRALGALAWLLVAAVGIEVVTNDVRIAARWNGPPVTGEPAERFHLVGPGSYLELYMHYPQRNVGTPACYDPVPWEISPALWIGDVPQARVQPATAGTVHETTRTNHTASVHVTLTAPARVVLNQNHDPDWSVSVGTAVEDRGRLAVDLPAGEHRVLARYWPADLPWSALVSLLGLALCLALTFASPRRLARLRRRAGATGLAGGERGE